MPKPEVTLAPPWRPAASVSRICTPRDASPVYRTATSMLSSVGIFFNSCDLTAWSKKISIQSGGGLTKMSEFRSELSFTNIASSTFRFRFVPWPRSSCVASFSLVYS
jgi:hypothetical protein